MWDVALPNMASVAPLGHHLFNCLSHRFSIASTSSLLLHAHLLMPGFIGNADFALSQMSSAPVPNHYHLFFWNWVFCAASTTILSGAVAERATLLSYCMYAVFYSSWVYPVAAHWNWSNQGWLSPTNPDPLLGVGCIDFAGSGTSSYFDLRPYLSLIV